MWTTERFPALWLLPVLLPVAAFTIFPVAHALWTSLHQVMLLFPGEEFVGLDNYVNVITGEYFGVALKNSLLFTVCLGARCGRSRHRDRDLPEPRVLRRRARCARSCSCPGCCPGAISAVLWVWVFHPSWGVINSVLCASSALIDRSIPWLTNPRPRLRLGHRRACLDADSVHRRPDDGGALDAQSRADRGGDDRRRNARCSASASSSSRTSRRSSSCC